MYSTNEIAVFLEVSPRTVGYYINKGYLKASLVGADYQISSRDFMDFKEHYFYSKKNKNKGKGNRPNMKKITLFKELYEKIKDGMSAEEFIKNLLKLDIKIPTIEELERANRNYEIIQDYKSGILRDGLSEKYSLPVKTIEEIIYTRSNQKLEI